MRTSNAIALEGAYVFEGVEVTLPVIVRKARAAAATFVVKAAAARSLLPNDDLAIMEFAPGRTLFTLGAIDYIDNDLGDYNEVSMAFYVRPRGAPRGIPYLGAWTDFLAGRASTYIHRLPVDQSFTCAAGRGIWGFPKSVEQIAFTVDGDRAQCRLDVGGRHVLTLETRRHGRRTLADSAMTTYSYIDGVLHETAFRSGADGVGFSRGGALVVLGDHPIADELRSLGLPKAALLTVWMERMRGRFEAPRPVA
jgi:hypothetical protein